MSKEEKKSKSCSKRKPKVSFTSNPSTTSWTASATSGVGGLEVDLFLVGIAVTQQNDIVSIDASVTAEIINVADNAFDTFRLYINRIQVAQAGFEAESNVFAPNISTCNLIWGGKLPKGRYSIRVTAQLTPTGGNTTIPTSNVITATVPFGPAKGAFLRVLQN